MSAPSKRARAGHHLTEAIRHLYAAAALVRETDHDDSRELARVVEGAAETARDVRGEVSAKWLATLFGAQRDVGARSPTINTDDALTVAKLHDVIVEYVLAERANQREIKPSDYEHASMDMARIRDRFTAASAALVAVSGVDR